MKRLLLVLFLIPSITFGAFTEFYCDASTGSNLNGGSDAGTVTYTSTNGNWNGTSTFTPTDGTNPVSAGVTVGQFASVYLDGATLGVYIARVTAVTNAANGAITLSTTAKAGSPPASGATGRTIKVGGALKGPNGTTTYPLTLSSLNAATNASSDQVRFNLKNNASYALTTSVNWNQSQIVIQGYSSTVGDGGKALITNNATAGSVQFQTTGGQSVSYIDIIWESTGGSGTNQVCFFAGSGTKYIRNVFRGGRNDGLALSGAAQTLYGCEIYGNNVANTSGHAGCTVNSGHHLFINTYIHDNLGSNTNGVLVIQSATFYSCIFDSNGASGVLHNTSTGGGASDFYNCDFYNNVGDGFKYASAAVQGFTNIFNCNFIKNGGKGINITVTGQSGWAVNNGYGSGTQANGSADALGSMVSTGAITYTSNVTPYAAPSTGNFSIVNNQGTGQAIGSGFSVFTEVDGTNTGTVGYPDVGAAQHQDTCAGLGPCQTSGASAQ